MRCLTGEMLVGPKSTLFLDEISTGLDSSTTYLIVKCMRNFVHLAQGTMLMSLLQPAPEVGGVPSAHDALQHGGEYPQ